MSILIKGMEMPTSCDDCRFCGGTADTDCGPCAWCDVDGKARVAGTRQDCPLVPVPVHHGRLIDADALEALFWDGQCYFTENIKYKIKNIETICPAEEGET